MAVHASGCAVHNAPAMEPGRCDCGEEVPWGDPKFGARATALRFAIDSITDRGISSDKAADIAAQFVDAAKVYEAYLRSA